MVTATTNGTTHGKAPAAQKGKGSRRDTDATAMTEDKGRLQALERALGQIE